MWSVVVVPRQAFPVFESQTKKKKRENFVPEASQAASKVRGANCDFAVVGDTVSGSWEEASFHPDRLLELEAVCRQRLFGGECVQEQIPQGNEDPEGSHDILRLPGKQEEKKQLFRGHDKIDFLATLETRRQTDAGEVLLEFSGREEDGGVFNSQRDMYQVDRCFGRLRRDINNLQRRTPASREEERGVVW